MNDRDRFRHPMRRGSRLGVALALLAVAGCATPQAAQAPLALEFPDDRAIGPGDAAGVAPAAQRDRLASFVADRRARDRGDVLTVIIVEDARVAQSARTRGDRSQSLNGELLQQDGVMQRWQGSLGTGYAGGGSIERSGRLLGRLAVVVVRVDADGNLRVRGAQDIVINGERQEMRLEGIVRPDDVAADNTIPSWRITGARISLTGEGFLTRKQRPGIVQQLLALFGV